MEAAVNGQTAGGVFLMQPGRVPNRQPVEQGRRFPIFGGSCVSSLHRGEELALSAGQC